MEARIVPATYEDKLVVRNLMELYCYDFSEFDGADVDSHGLYGYAHLDAYWTEEHRSPFLIRVADQWAGFALVMDIEGAQRSWVHWMAEFFVMRKYRRQGVGRIAAWQLFDAFPGTWQVAQLGQNGPARQFWRTVIGRYTDRAYREIEVEHWDGPVQEFQSPPECHRCAGGSSG